MKHTHALTSPRLTERGGARRCTRHAREWFIEIWPKPLLARGFLLPFIFATSSYLILV
jgi:hypothetical protein